MGTNNSTNNFGISRYIVSAIPGNGSYRTIQVAVNAATAAGGGSRFLQQGMYTEDLDLSAITNFVEVVGATGLGDEGQVESLVTLTLPDSQQIGDILQVVGFGASGWKIAQNAGQIIHLCSSATTTEAAGFLEFVDQYDCVSL